MTLPFNARLLLIRPDYANIGLMKDYYKSKTVFILGSYNEIHKSTEDNIKRFMPKAKVVRIGSPDQYQRNLETLRISGLDKKVAVTDGRKFPDGLTAAGFCDKKNIGLRVVDGSKAYDLASGTSVEYTIGGKNSVNQDGGKRISGDDRYETAKEVARNTDNYLNIIFVDGTRFPDSINAINLIKPREAIVMPIADRRDNSDMKEFLANLPETKDLPNQWDIEKSGYALVVGGPNSLSDKTVVKMLYPSK